MDFDSNHFTVGWICALSKELSAAKAAFDEVYEPLPNKKGDANTYHYGRIGTHNVVVTCHGNAGLLDASIAASHMQSSFPDLELHFLVGIGGGLPSEDHDIRLGDVVVGKRVIQYDLGKTEHNGKFITTLSPMALKPIFQSAIASMEVDRQLDSQIQNHLSKMRETDHVEGPHWSYQGSQHDQLFIASYSHLEGESNPTCANCDTNELVKRKPRASTSPFIHYGTIASANNVMKHGPSRDELRVKLKPHVPLCVEMEAAGIMKVFSCLVVRGICDYADTHKNKRWQNYAAATAAAFAKQLLLQRKTELHRVVRNEKLRSSMDPSESPSSMFPIGATPGPSRNLGRNDLPHTNIIPPSRSLPEATPRNSEFMPITTYAEHIPLIPTTSETRSTDFHNLSHEVEHISLQSEVVSLFSAELRSYTRDATPASPEVPKLQAERFDNCEVQLLESSNDAHYKTIKELCFHSFENDQQVRKYCKLQRHTFTLVRIGSNTSENRATT